MSTQLDSHLCCNDLRFVYSYSTPKGYEWRDCSVKSYYPSSFPLSSPPEHDTPSASSPPSQLEYAPLSLRQTIGGSHCKI